MSPVVFVVPGNPQGKGRPRVGRVGGHARMYTPPKTAEYEKLIAEVSGVAMKGRALITGPVLAELDIIVPVPQSWSKKRKLMALQGDIYPTTKPDKDNVIKAIYDGINDVVWKDDVQVVDGHQRKRYGETPMVKVRIVPLEGEPAQGARARNV